MRVLADMLIELTTCLLSVQSDVASMEQTLTQAVHAASPILVIDAQCLCTHIKIIRQFVACEQFIVVIPLHGMYVLPVVGLSSR